ncbi:MAG TPA: hypothetical protein VF423_15165 [Actinomycetes bacterium]|jgi:hypothetical protein
MSGLPALLDLTDDGALTLADGLGWVLALSALGLLILLVGTAIFAALVWTARGLDLTVRWTAGRAADLVVGALHHAAMHERGTPQRHA